MKFKKNRRKMAPILGGLFFSCSLCLVTSCRDGYDLADEDPSWLGSSIYDYLQSNGNYTNTVRLIDDLGYREVLAKTGSKTLFVADDNAFDRFFRSGKYGAKCYEELSTAQKKQLLFGAMINNACQVAYLSSAAGPIEGDCMRRLTSVSAYDTVPMIRPEQMPDNPNWAYYKSTGKTIPCLRDLTTQPMIHFIEDFLNNRRITNEDCNFLFNYEIERKAGDANINGVMMEEQNIRCSNGFVHKMAEVITPLPNLAELIENKPQTSEYSKLLERFSAPYYCGEAVTREYNRLYGTSYDSVFQKRYFSERSQNGVALNLTPQDGPVEATLKFDPGWNEFYSEMNASTATNVALQENMAVMLVPTNEALNRYWNEEGGKVLKDRYGTWENVPDQVVSKMLNVNMLNSFINSVPSKFSTVLNDANDELGLSLENVDSVFFACNGAVYLTNKVFNPVSYISVSFPALVNETMNVLYWGIEQLKYDIYLNSQNSYYSFFIPTNNALLEYVDPCSFGKTETQLFRFHYDASAQTEGEKVWASIWNYNTETHVVGDSIGEANYTQITNRLKDILDTHIVIGNVESGNKYYQTKNGSTIVVENAGKGNMTVSGGWQVEKGEKVNVTTIYDQSVEGNGKAYILESSPVMTSRKSVADILAEHEEFSAFLELLEGTPYLSEKYVIGTEEHACPSRNISLFNTFHYTVYVPTNESIRALQEAGDLPTWDDVENAEDEEEKERLTEEINQFVKYHIQDNALYIGQGKIAEAQYETAAYEVDNATNTLSYFKLDAKGDNTGIEVEDRVGNVRHVVTSGGLYNLMAREYQYDSPDNQNASTIYTSSFAVVHQIDGPLMWKAQTEE